MPALARRALAALALSSSCLAPALARGDELALSAPDSPALDRAAVIRAVLARNPSAAAAEATVRAADARAEAAGALANPSLRTELAPRALGDGGGGFRVVLAQPLAWFGQRGLARDAARADADAERFGADALRLDLALAASQRFDDYYLAARALALNASHRELVATLRASSLARYEAGEATQQAPLAAELEAAQLAHREVELETQQRVTAAQLNVLLHRAPDEPLPPPPASLEPPAADELLAAQPSERPELRAAEAKAAARATDARRVHRERLPALSAMAGYDGMWDAAAMRPMVGVEMELPLARTRRHAAIEEADALRDMAERQRESAARDAELAVTVARERFAEAHHGLGIVREQMLPAARDQAEAANAALAAGRGELGDAIAADRAWIETELEAEEAVVTASRRAAELRRALGRSGLEEQP